MLRMEQVAVIRHKGENEEKSIRSVAKELGISRNTVSKYLKVPEPVADQAGKKQATASKADGL